MAEVLAHNYHAPTVEDYDSDCSNAHLFARPSPAAANVSTKRSHPSDLDKEKTPAQERVSPNIDLRSDSGYSSFTAATVSSADSAPSATSQRSPPHAPATTNIPAQPQSPAPKTRRPTLSSAPSTSSTGSRPSRTASQSQRRPTLGSRRPTITQERRDARDDECTDPNCTSCGPNAVPRRRSEQQTPPTPRDDPASYYASPPRHPFPADHHTRKARPLSPRPRHIAEHLPPPANVP